MPNVMGREFPYTPQGVAGAVSEAAETLKRFVKSFEGHADPVGEAARAAVVSGISEELVRAALQYLPEVAQIPALPLLPPGTGRYGISPASLNLADQDQVDAYYGGGVPGPSFSPGPGQTAPDLRNYMNTGAFRGVTFGDPYFEDQLLPGGGEVPRPGGGERPRGMRGGGMMGFRPLGYADGDLVMPEFYDAPVDASTGVGRAVGQEAFGRDLPPSNFRSSMGDRGDEGGAISNAIDTVQNLVRQFAAQDVPDPVKAAVNAAIGTFGIPVDLVNSALGALGIPVSDTPIGGSRNIKETFGMRRDGTVELNDLIDTKDMEEAIKALSNRDTAGMRQMIDNPDRGAVELLDTDIYPDDNWTHMYPDRPHGPEYYDRYGQDMADRQWVEGSTGIPVGVSIPGIDVADGGYITRKMNRGGIMSLRGY